MRKLRFLYIFSAILALSLFFPGCEDGPPAGGGSTGPGTGGSTSDKNGSLFYAKAGDGKHVFISIYTPTNKAIANNDSYAVAVLSLNGKGESDYDGEPKSAGKIAVNGTSLTFTPSSGYTGGGSGILAGNILTMAQVPGTTYTNLTMTQYATVVSTPTRPFGPSDPYPPDNSSGGSGGGSTVNTPPAASGGPYYPGKIVTAIKVLTNPNWGILTEVAKTGGGFTNTSSPSSYYYEGEQIYLPGKGMVVQVTFSDNETRIIPDNELNGWFVVDPPDVQSTYSANNHTLYYRNGFTNSITGSTISDKFSGPGGANGGAIIPIHTSWNHIGFTSGGTDVGIIVNHLRTPRGVLAPWYEDEQFFNADAGLGIIYNYQNIQTTSTSSTAKSPVPDVLKNLNLTDAGTYDFCLVTIPRNNKVELPSPIPAAPATITVKVHYGSQIVGNTTPSVPAGWVTSFTTPTVYEVSKIALSGQPAFPEQILFDDPRLFNRTNDAKTNAHWLSKITDVNLNVYYKGLTTPRVVNIVQAYNNAPYAWPSAQQSANAHKFIDPPGPNSGLTKVALGFQYYSHKNAQEDAYAIEVPVFNNLLSIEIVGSPLTYPIMYHTSSAGVVLDNLTQFMGKVKVYAYYECGKNGTVVQRTDTWAQMNGTDKSCDSSITTDASDYGFLSGATFSYSKGKYTKARVILTAPNGTVKTNSIEIGAVGYQ